MKPPIIKQEYQNYQDENRGLHTIFDNPGNTIIIETQFFFLVRPSVAVYKTLLSNKCLLTYIITSLKYESNRQHVQNKNKYLQDIYRFPAMTTN